MRYEASLEADNRRLLGKLLVLVAAMLGFCAALVPLYRQICSAIGLADTRLVASANTQVDASRSITVELFASSASLPWRFEAIDRVVSLRPGELATVRYRVVNTLGRPIVAHAVMNTAPARAMRYIEKQECFCFTDQAFAAGEEREMPVVFRVRTDAPADLTTLSLSYTFFEKPSAPPKVSTDTLVQSRNGAGRWSMAVAKETPE
jgi:cytochrome c oxidase assembly protein subunit 11